MKDKKSISKKYLNNIIKEYDIGNLKSFKIYKQGQAHTNIFLHTSKGKFVLKRYNKRSKNEILCELEILEHLNKFNFPCIKPLMTNSKKLYFMLENQFFIIYRYIEGELINKPNVTHMIQVARLLAEFHKISKNFKPKHHSTKLFDNKNRLLKKVKMSLQKLNNKQIAEERMAFFEKMINQVKFPKTLPKGITHGDYSQANILFKNNNVSVVLDFDGASYGYLVFDLASLIYFWAWFKEPKRKLNLQKAKFLLNEYQKIRSLSKVEKDCIYDALLFRTLIYLSWHINDIKYDKEIKTNYYEFFKGIVEQVVNIKKDE